MNPYLFVEKEDHTGVEKPLTVAYGLKQSERFVHAILQDQAVVLRSPFHRTLFVRRLTYCTFVFMQHLIIFTHGHNEYDCVNLVKAMDPFPITIVVD